jgi:hypothetical protein
MHKKKSSSISNGFPFSKAQVHKDVEIFYLMEDSKEEEELEYQADDAEPTMIEAN